MYTTYRIHGRSSVSRDRSHHACLRLQGGQSCEKNIWGLLTKYKHCKSITHKLHKSKPCVVRAWTTAQEETLTIMFLPAFRKRRCAWDQYECVEALFNLETGVNVSPSLCVHQAGWYISSISTSLSGCPEWRTPLCPEHIQFSNQVPIVRIKYVHEADFSRNTKKSLSAKPGEKGEWGHDLIRALLAKGKDMSSMSWQ